MLNRKGLRSEEREFFQFMTLDGDNWPAILGVNKDGKAEIFGMDSDSSYYEFYYTIWREQNKHIVLRGIQYFMNDAV